GIFVSGANASANIHDNSASIHGNAVGIEVSGGTATISNNHIYGNTTGVEFTAGGSGSLSGDDFRGSTAMPAAANNSTDLLIDATAGAVSLSGDTLAGNTFISNQKNAELEATGETFVLGATTVTPSDSTLADLYDVEDRITDGLDPSQSGGLVRLRAGNVYVTQSSDSIQRGVNLALAGNSLYVQAGLYQENVSINKALSLHGANAGTAGAAASGAMPTRSVASETEVLTNGNQNAVFTVTAGNVTIDGFYLEGNDPGATGATLTSGDDSNAIYGIRASSGVSNLTIENSVVKDVQIGFRGDSSASNLTNNNLITRNWFDGIGIYDFGYAVNLRSNFYADVTNNLMTRVQSGIQTNNFSGAGGPASWLYQDNTISAYGAGIWQNLQFNQATSVTIDGNTITSLHVPNIPANAAALANSEGHSIGILLVSIQDHVGATVTNNDISGMAYGVTLYNTTTANTITLGATNDIHGNGVGVYLTNKVDFNPVTMTVLGGTANNPTGTGTAVLNGITLTGNTTGVLVNDSNNSTTFGTSLTLQNGVTI
ncbi:MAG TPA: hypothetical protein VGI75_05090, partial [Pirellulales bacterium]